MIRTSSNQIEVTITSVDRDARRINGCKVNKQMRGFAAGAPFSVYFKQDGEPHLNDGIGRPHPKLVIAAARAAWNNL